MKNRLFVSFDFFDFKTLKIKQENDVKSNFLVEIHREFHKYSRNSETIYEFRKNILKSKNDGLFYVGINEINESEYSEEKLSIGNFVQTMKKSFSSIEISDEIKIVKNKIGKNNNGKSLLCCLVILNYKNKLSPTENSEIGETYLLFPLKYKDFHK